MRLTMALLVSEERVREALTKAYDHGREHMWFSLPRSKYLPKLIEEIVEDLKKA